MKAISVLAILLISIGALAADSAVRKVTIVPVRRYSNLSQNPDYGCCGIASVGVNWATAYFSMDVRVSDDESHIYSVDCFEYHSWNHCRLPEANSYSAEIKGKVMQIITPLKDGKHTSKTKYKISYVRPVQPFDLQPVQP